MAMKSETRAAEYHAKARDAAALAASSVLHRVRELHELAASRWTLLAELEDRRTVSLAQRFDRAAQAETGDDFTLLDEDAVSTA